MFIKYLWRLNLTNICNTFVSDWKPVADADAVHNSVLVSLKVVDICAQQPIKWYPALLCLEHRADWLGLFMTCCEPLCFPLYKFFWEQTLDGLAWYSCEQSQLEFQPPGLWIRMRVRELNWIRTSLTHTPCNNRLLRLIHVKPHVPE